MTTATVTTDINIGDFKIPSNGQNMIMNYYAQKNNISVEFVIPEPLLSNHLATLLWCHKNYNFKKVILCSIHQLPHDKKKFENILSKTENVEFHFALEGLKGKGKLFLKNCYKEAKKFSEAKKIDSSQNNWIDFYNKFKKGHNY